MRAATFLSTRRLVATVIAVWLGSGSLAWAGGGGGADAATIQSFLDTTCSLLSMTNCPQLPTVTQGVLEVAGLQFARPESIRRSQNIAGAAVYAGNPTPLPATPPVPLTLPVTPAAFAALGLQPIAFLPASGHDNNAPTAPGYALPTQMFDHEAGSFLSAVTTYDTVAGPLGAAVQPHVLTLFYDDMARRSQRFQTGQIVANVSLPLTVYNSTAVSERGVMTILRIRAVCPGGPDCLTADAIGDFAGTGTPQTRPASDIGVKFALVFGPSPTAEDLHAIFEVQVPLLVTLAFDPVHFNAPSNPAGSTQSFVTSTVTFINEDFGSPLGGGNSIGIAPYAAPGSYASLPPAPITFFGLCASLPDDSNGAHAPLVPAVAAFLSIATDGETLAGAPLGATSSLQCPF
jgi:hypothetical protein